VVYGLSVQEELLEGLAERGVKGGQQVARVTDARHGLGLARDENIVTVAARVVF
jgi:hypothetical protein